jgi:hypothetical protein
MKSLRGDPLVLDTSRSCRKSANVSAEEIPASWFIASAIHLDGPNEEDLVILPKNQCMNGANTGPFWIARKESMGYAVILSTGGNDLLILRSEHKGHSDVQVLTHLADKVTTVTFEFDGQNYKRRSATTRAAD